MVSASWDEAKNPLATKSESRRLIGSRKPAMAKKLQKVLPHGQLEVVVPGIWMVTGMCGIPLRRQMTVWKAADGSLVVHSPIAMDEGGMAKLDTLGRVSTILVPHGGHRMDIEFYKRRYPDAQVVAPAAAKAVVEEVLAVDNNAEDVLPQKGTKIHPLPGWKHGELGYQVSLPDGGQALVLCDVLTNAYPAPGVGGWLVSKLTNGVTAPLGVARIVRRMLLADRAAARTGIERLAELPDLRLISIAHGHPVKAGCAQALRDAAARI